MTLGLGRKSVIDFFELTLTLRAYSTTSFFGRKRAAENKNTDATIRGRAGGWY